MRLPFSPDPCQHLLLFVFLIVAILTGVRWNYNVVLIFTSFMARDVEHFFMSFFFFFFFKLFELLPLKKLCLAHLLISSLGH
jgi:hypothetical protein